ncbi:hypothetical protein [Bacteroides sp. 519]|uniref:hypothetical protein n=1 Tax=Bacteroides sp. 519 TaxID=2302937 RepID=UPI0013D5B0B4|nr:hypothetical protein [Bacteroides sp. 519]NDV60341.1 hypothetical protein [Bacteroides sp. 519]
MATITFDENTEEGRTLLYIARTMKRASRKGVTTIIIDAKKPAKDETLETIHQGLCELKLMKQGKLKARPIEELLNEL